MNGDSFQVVAGSFSRTVAKDETFTVNNHGKNLSITISGGGTEVQSQQLVLW
jgi:hypothetical protein